MSGTDVLIDSVILIDHFNGIEAATAYLRSVKSQAFLSPITRAEVLVGFEVTEQAGPRAVLDQFSLLPIDREVADLAADLRRTHGWKLPDALQAAVATRHDLALATRNTKDFAPEEHDWVRVPYLV